jgi:1-acyl-sn-glycerol-3-phosphate acyltransferase
MSSLLSLIVKKINNSKSLRILLSIIVYFNIFIATVIYCSIVVIPLFCGVVILWMLKRPDGILMRYTIVLYGAWISLVAIRPFIRLSYCDTAKDEAGTGIYICNHRSASDPFWAWVFTNNMVQIVNGWPMRLFFFGFFARRGEYLDITRLNYDQAREKISRLIQSGVSIVAFPEGTRSGTRKMNKFHSMIFRVAHELQLRIYPCCILGDEEIPNRKFLLSSGEIKVYKLPKVESADYAGRNPYCLKEAVWNLINDAIKKYEN